MMTAKTSRNIPAGKYYIYTLFFLCPFLGLAQSKPHPGAFILTGKIIDGQTRQPVRSATVALLRRDSSVETENISQADGEFTLKGLPEDSCTLRVSVIGYQPFSRIIAGSRRMEPFDAGTIRLMPVPAQLQTVTVVGERSAFKTEIDKKVFNVDKSLASKGGTAQDALRQVPTLSVDATGNVSLRNGSPVILLDGKQTQLTLDQIPADQIQSVEVMPNPSAKYDAQGNHGIVNIVLKKNRKPGLNGSVTGVWNSLHETYGFLNMNAYKGKWNFTLNYMAHGHRSVENTTTTLTDLNTNTSVIQHGHSVTLGPFQMAKAGVDFFMDPHNTFSISGNIGFGHHPTTGAQTTDYPDATGQLDSSSTRTSYESDNFVFAHANFDYTHIFKKENEKLTAGAALESYHGPGSGNYSMQYLDKEGTALGSPYLQQYNGIGRAHRITLQSDLTNPFQDGKMKIEAGIKAVIHANHSQNDFQDYSTATQGYTEDSAASYNYSYNDNTYAAYGSFTDQLGRFSYMAGLRLERYDYTGHLLDNNSSFGFHTSGLYPSLFLTEKMGDNSELHLNYSRRVNRPQWWQISPETNYTNPQNPQVGNPHIRPENTNLVELAYYTQFAGTGLNATLYVKNTLSPMTAYNIPLSKDTLLSTYENANSSNTYGAEIILKTPVAKWWNVTSNLNFFETDINADNLSQGLSNSGFSWFAKLNSDMKLLNIYTLQLTGSYNAPNVVAQGKILASGGMDAAIKRDFLKNNAGTLVISLADIFNTQRTRVQTYSQGVFFQDAITKPETRVLKINFTYTFGKEITGERHKATSISNG
jgi:iron complex outermembrane receptor protein